MRNIPGTEVSCRKLVSMALRAVDSVCRCERGV